MLMNGMIRSRTMSVAQRTPVRKHPVTASSAAGGAVVVGRTTASSSAIAVALPATKAAAAAVTVATTGSPLQRLWKAYTNALHRQPLLTKASMASIIFFSSDSATQYILHHTTQPNQQQQQQQDEDFEWDAVRALSGASFGVIATTWLHYWWGFLEVAVGSRLPVAQYKLANTVTKVIVDQGIGAPLYIYSYYCITNLAAAATSKSNSNSVSDLIRIGRELHNKASDMLWPTMCQHWKLWPAVHLCNFHFTPLPHRILVQNTVLVGWSGYLSHLNHNNSLHNDASGAGTGADEATSTTTTTTIVNKAKLMTPNEEINVALVRRDTQIRLQKQQQQQQKQQQAVAAAAVSFSE